MLLQNVVFFADIPTDQLSFLANIAEVRTYNKDDVLFKENEPSDALYIIGNGIVNLFYKEQLIREVAENEAVGALGFFDQKPRIYTAKCKNSCTTLVFDSMLFFDLLEDRVQITHHLLRYFVTELRNAITANGITGKYA
ncbi:MAG: cyclic nucleotide-binding domain-containing protein [Bacteroidales bacterium]|nr:cyclic nucleotide-binding domain-containing protein [Bacteroidales bacterium]